MEQLSIKVNQWGSAWQQTLMLSEDVCLDGEGGEQKNGFPAQDVNFSATFASQHKFVGYLLTISTLLVRRMLWIPGDSLEFCEFPKFELAARVVQDIHTTRRRLRPLISCLDFGDRVLMRRMRTYCGRDALWRANGHWEVVRYDTCV